MRPFPVFLDLDGRPCLVVGGGRVGCRKARGLLEAGARVLVVEPSPGPGLLALKAEHPALELRQEAFEAAHCRGFLLVLACTNVPAVNQAVARAACSAGVLCSRADGGGDFSGAALLRRGDLCVAVSTGGRSPALAALARDRAASVVGDEFGQAALLLAGLRREVLAAAADSSPGDAFGVDPSQRDAFGVAMAAALVEALEAGRGDEARRLVDEARSRALAFLRENESASGSPRCTR